jgi:aminoglycoside phosphotransferase family enzyme/predicted kinase
MTPDDTDDRVLAFLGALASDDPARPDIERIDTHANIVFLVGTKAYKIKRSVAFPFLDYSTLALREEACKREITYNARYAPDLYLKAVPVTEQADGTLALDGAGKPVEWTVVMKRFDKEGELDRIASEGPLPNHLSDALAGMMVAAHKNAPVRDAEDFFQELSSYVEQNATAFADHPELFPPAEAAHLTETARAWLTRIHTLILSRGRHDLIRLCHGDAHLRNIVLIDGQPELFDAVEFSDGIATCDVLYDLAFLLMDLWERGQKRAANLVFNRYFDKAQRDSDIEGLAALPFYMMMRAAIRAKIAASAALNQSDPDERSRQEEMARTYFHYAVGFLDPEEPMLTAIGGLSGTGKTTLAYGLAPDIGRAPGARVLRTDVERKARLGIAENEPAPASAYTREASDAVYAAIDRKIQSVLAAGHSAIFDAVFAKEEERTHVEQVAAMVEAGFCGLWLEAPEAVLKERVAGRADDASDATVAVVATQLGYETGDINWPVVDAGGSYEDTLSGALESLGQNRA